MYGPNARYRIYTSPKHYGRVLSEIARGFQGDDSDCRRLEEAVAERVGVAHAIFMPQNRVATYMAVRALVKPGRKVILSPYTLSDVVNMVLCAGARPVFADVQRKTCNIDPDEIEKLIDDETDAVLVTHLHGLVCDMERIGALCKKHGLRLLEDAAQAFGARRDGTAAGAFGDAGAFSFGMYKNVNSFYGGMLVTPHADVAQQIRAMLGELPRESLSHLMTKVARGLATDVATHPLMFKALVYRVFQYGYLHDVEFLNRRVTIESNVERKHQIPSHYLVRPTALQARLAQDGLAQVDQDTRARIAIARVYHEGLADIPELTLPPFAEDLSHVYIHYPLQSPRREELIRYMVANGRDVAVQHLRNCAELDAFAEFARLCPNAEACARQNILLSTYPRFSTAEAERNVRAIRAFHGCA